MKIFGTHDDGTKTQLETCVAAEEGAKGVLCADGHLGYSMPIGGVVGYRGSISPSGVGYDIACGNLAVKLDIKAADLTLTDYNRIADMIHKNVSFGIGQTNPQYQRNDQEVIDKIDKFSVRPVADLWSTARQQLGTVGSGNHYVDVLEDTNGYLWIAVHFGSRGFGHKTATGFLNLANGIGFSDKGHEGEMMSPPVLIDASTPLGQDYIAAMQLAGEYAYAGRDYVVRTVMNIMGASDNVVLDYVHNHHNFAWREDHNGEMLWVVRKGATPAFPGQKGFVGGSMGDISVIIEGVDSPESQEALYSTMHGAGRVMSRKKAKGKTKRIGKWRCLDYRKCNYMAAKGGHNKVDNPRCPNCGHKLKLEWMEEQLAPGLVDFTAVKKMIDGMGIVLRGAGADESPMVYRPLQTVLDAHKNTIRVLETFKPRIVVMAGAEVFDPYKD